VPVVTTLTQPVQQQQRLHRYLAIMAVALVCFVSLPWLPFPLAVVAAVLAAILLPTAAIVANGSRRPLQPGAGVQDARAKHPEAPDPQHRVIDPDR
jgi:Flp pilus assembly protein TadB